MTNGSQQNSDKYEIKRQTISVNPKACLWFAWAEPGFTGPEPFEESGEEFRPLGYDPEGAETIKIFQADKNFTWSHDTNHGDSWSDARGITWDPDKVVSLQCEGYRNYPGNIEIPGAMPVCKLVILFEIPDSGGGYQPLIEPVEVGIEDVQDAQEIIVPPGTIQYFLGFHDGKNWTNNGENEMDFIVESRKRVG